MSSFGADVLIDDGKIGVVNAGDVLDASGYDTVLKARGNTNEIHFQNASGEFGAITPHGIEIQKGNVSAPSVITVGVALGVKNSSGTQLAEIKSNGNLVISGNTFYTTQSSVYYSAGASFDGFDMAEIVPCDAEYADGTIVCPAENGTHALCDHDNCPCASVISHVPGVCLGEADHDKHYYPLALVGRVKVHTQEQLTFRTPVCSDGRGGVRAIRKGETGCMIGFTLDKSVDGVVPIQLRFSPVTVR